MRAGASSGNSTDSSMPYMCCGGTVATMPGRASPHRSRRADRFCPVLATNAPQVLALALGAPVLPEVKPITTSWAGCTNGIGPSASGSSSGITTTSAGPASTAASLRHQVRG
jgi:hypothetical protein